MSQQGPKVLALKHLLLTCCHVPCSNDGHGDTDGWEGDIEDGADHSQSESLRNAASSPSAQSGAAERTHVSSRAEEETPKDSATLEPPSSTVQQESGGHDPRDAVLSQSAPCSEAVTTAQQQDTGLQVQAVRNLSASSVEKPETPPRLASPKSPQPARSAVADGAARRDATTDNPGSPAPEKEPVQQGPADSVEQMASVSSQDAPGRGPNFWPTHNTPLHGRVVAIEVGGQQQMCQG